MAQLLRLLKYATYPFLGLSVLLVLGLAFGIAFIASFTIENRTDAVLVVTPVGAAGPEGDRLPLPVVLFEFLPLPAFRGGEYRLLPEESITIYYDMDDIKFSEILVEVEPGRLLQLVTNSKPTSNQYHAPLQRRYVIDDLSQLEPASLPVQTAAHAAGRQGTVAWVTYSLLLGPWLVYGIVSWLSSRLRKRNDWNGFPPNGRKIVPIAMLVAWIVFPSALWAEPPTGGEITIRSESALPKVLTDEQFRQKLEARIPGVSWDGAPLRDVLREMMKASQLSIIRDRRIDPTRPLKLSLNQQTHEATLAKIADAVGAEARVVGCVVYLGPPEAAGAIRTLVEMRSGELAGFRSLGLRASRERLSSGKTVSWGDLAEPRGIIDRIAGEFRLEILNPEAIPHDLWEGGALPAMTAAELLTVVLIQFDMTFAWDNDLQAIRLIPLPSSPQKIAVERSYKISNDKQETFQNWRRESPFATVRQAGGRQVVLARLERHEELDRLLEGNKPPENEPVPGAAPLERRRFTLTVTGVPAQAIMDQLEASGITFEYDAETLEQAGIDFATPVSMDLDSATPEAFLTAVFDPLGLDFEFSGTKVRLRPKE